MVHPQAIAIAEFIFCFDGHQLGMATGNTFALVNAERIEAAKVGVGFE